MLVAAEPSGDALGAQLASALRAKLGDQVSMFGIGGPLMAREGINSPFDIAPLAVVGVFDALRVYPLVRRRAKVAGEIAARLRPDVAVLIDSWGFNLRVAHAIRRLRPDITLVKYVGPQVWATRPGRARTLARAVDRLLTIHAFDAPCFEAAGLPTIFVGNPVLTIERPDDDVVARFKEEIGAGLADPILLIAPGSRRGEVERLMRPFGVAAARLAARSSGLKVVVIAAEAVAEQVESGTRAWSIHSTVVHGEGWRRSAMAAATAALACSGTVTTELAMMGAPVVVGYRLDPLAYPVAKILIRTPHITLLNIAAGSMVAPEFIQGACAGPRLVAALSPLLHDPVARGRQVAAQNAALQIMRGGISNPAAAAADAVIASVPAASPVGTAGS
jgi:lipid-A-disaccharide synthase